MFAPLETCERVNTAWLQTGPGSQPDVDAPVLRLFEKTSNLNARESECAEETQSGVQKQTGGKLYAQLTRRYDTAKLFIKILHWIVKKKFLCGSRTQ